MILRFKIISRSNLGVIVKWKCQIHWWKLTILQKTWRILTYAKFNTSRGARLFYLKLQIAQTISLKIQSVNKKFVDTVQERKSNPPTKQAKTCKACLFKRMLLGHLNSTLSHFRREGITPELNSSLHQTSFEPRSLLKFIFGDDLPNQPKMYQRKIN